MQTPDQILTPFAEQGVKNTIPETGSQSDVLASKQLGFPPLTMQTIGGTPPDGRDMNGILNELYRMMRFLQAGGVYPYSSTFATAIGGYPIGARVLCSDNKSLWINTVAGNMTDPDDSDTAQGWLLHQVEQSSLYSSAYIGSIVMWAKPESTIPVNALVCKGQQLNSTNYPELYTAWFGTYQAGQLFNLPNFSGGYYPRGFGNTTQTVGTRSSGALPNITGICGTSWMSGSKFAPAIGKTQITGAFAKANTSTTGYGVNDANTSSNDPIIDFKASRCSSLYKDTNTVETNNVAVNFIVFVR